MAKILAVDDDHAILALIKNGLELEGHVVETMLKPHAPVSAFLGYDLILLDVMMPEEDGFTLCQRIRSDVDTPILFLTAKTDETSIIQGLMKGADDYITKPFSVKTLNARVAAHLRRERRQYETTKRTISGITFDIEAKEVWIGNKFIKLTKTEYDITKFLAENKGRVFSKEDIYEAVYGLDASAQFSTITEFIRIIRKKLGSASPIETVWGVGYKWI